MKKKEKQAIKECVSLLKECIQYHNLHNKELIGNNLGNIKEKKGRISIKNYKIIEDYIEEYIKPLLYDTDYFNFIKKDDYGSYDSEGHFILNSESSLENTLFLIYDRSCDLEKNLQYLCKKCLNDFDSL